ncbi:hypothetical protein ACQPYA_03080 [Micromonospora sp. CA-263727]|uniref:hypothetical protein n=1 Tax=Micromonospora sp. CA-263727 TaxID=3239967 RepID=UPI003D8A4F66
MILSGPALYLVGRSRFEYEVFNRVSPSRMIAIGLLLALIPALLRAPPLAALTAAGLILAAVAVADAQRARGNPPSRRPHRCEHQPISKATRAGSPGRE